MPKFVLRDDSNDKDGKRGNRDESPFRLDDDVERFDEFEDPKNVDTNKRKAKKNKVFFIVRFFRIKVIVKRRKLIQTMTKTKANTKIRIETDGSQQKFRLDLVKYSGRLSYSRLLEIITITMIRIYKILNLHLRLKAEGIKIWIKKYDDIR